MNQTEFTSAHPDFPDHYDMDYSGSILWNSGGRRRVKLPELQYCEEDT